MDTFDAVFEAFGGATKLAEAIGIRPVHAQTMRNRKSIPAIYWLDIVEAAREKRIKGVTFDALAKISARERRA